MRAGGRPGRARPGPARLGGGGGSDGGGDSGGSGAGRGRRPHPTAAAAARLLLRSCCGSCSPAERGGRRRRRRLPLSPASRLPRPVPLPLPLPGRCLLSAARVSHQTPRPQCSAARAAERRRPKQGRALWRSSEPARCRAHLAVAPRQSVGSGREGARGLGRLAAEMGPGCFRARETRARHAELLAVPAGSATRSPRRPLVNQRKANTINLPCRRERQEQVSVPEDGNISQPPS
ncbi:protein FAM117B-like [Myotis daubentonii]|uniref:protein FAM117B-like n=1 Tax=Myotis daubentonii TaxID=98922 RepID=UPI002872D904|nr:protein FAM117B-like [Myotis daubentonii]